ncbi:MAG: heparan N-sulfatase [Verrucomicrobiales bacterium]|nr:heparan N-sulfatase [Verrucomicrobiales bacterium]
MPLRILVVLLIGLSFVISVPAAESISLNLRKAKPNIILIIADDMAWDDCGAYGHPSLPTPNIDRIASEGIRFGRAFLTTSSCSPSRASIITSRYPHSTGAEQLHWPLPQGQVTWVDWLRRSGYYTVAAGKWHLGPHAKQSFNRVYEARGRTNPSGCAEWLRALRAVPKGKPYFLWLASFDPHRAYKEGIIPTPTPPGDVVLPPYIPDTLEVRKDYARYYDEVRRLDSYVGSIMSELDERKEADNTFILFMSDNGRPFPRDKTTVYDSGIRTPFVMRWPGKIAPGGTSSSLVSSIDIGPTLLEVAGVRGKPSGVQGTSFMPILKDPGAEIREYIFAERNWHDFDAYGRAVRDGRFKYIRNYYFDKPLTPPADAVGSPTFQEIRRLREAKMIPKSKMVYFQTPRPYEELYDLEADPHEMNNLAKRSVHLSTMRRLRAVLDEWRASTEDKMPKTRTADEFDRNTGESLPTRVWPRVPPAR